MFRDYAPVPGILIPGKAAALRVVQWREVSLLFTTGEPDHFIGALARLSSAGTTGPRCACVESGNMDHG